MPSSIAQYFGFSGNKYTEITNVYFSIQEWMLVETQITSLSVLDFIQQVGLPININDQVSQLLIACPYSNDIKIYRIQFNLTDGKIIGFQSSGSLFLDFSKQYSFKTANNLIMIDSAYELKGNQSVDLFMYNVQDLLYSNMQVVPFISSKQPIFTSYRIFCQMRGDYYLLSGQYENRSLIINIKNSLIFNVSIYEDQQAEIEILAQNQQTQFQRSIFVMNEQNDDDDDNNDDDDDDNDENDDNDNDENDDNDNDENDENDDDNNDDDDENINPNQKFKSRLIIIIAVSILLIIIIIVIVVLYCKKKEKQQHSNEMSYQLV
ncbi:unnamed protein product [Paramecium pentaurelia]|uniref:Transmembrane protein n=1 Tax=Paramecium pentaurelia TaxID=43138 RepID=A0A8S1WD61_9CILI|nr:unnamed protein product [Paramecium pentaurelia]